MIDVTISYKISIDEDKLMKSTEFEGDDIEQKIFNFSKETELDLGYPEFVKRTRVDTTTIRIGNKLYV